MAGTPRCFTKMRINVRFLIDISTIWSYFFRANYIAINQGSINLIEQNKMIERSWREDYINSRVTRYYYWWIYSNWVDLAVWAIMFRIVVDGWRPSVRTALKWWWRSFAKRNTFAFENRSDIDWQLSVMSVIRDTRMQARCDSRADFRPACLVFISPFEWSILFSFSSSVYRRNNIISPLSFVWFFSRFSSPRSKVGKEKKYIKSTRDILHS